MKVLKYIGLGLSALIVIALVIIAIQSPQSHLERSIVVSASPASVFEEVNNFHNFNKFSPWFKLDPNAKYEFEGPESGVGAKMSWVGDPNKVGEGWQEIVESVEDQRVKTKMGFAGIEGDYYASFVLEPVDEGTKVTWTYDGDVSNTGMMNAAIGKMMGMFLDSMIGTTYEEGLVSLKEVVENKPEPEAQPDVQSDSTIVEQ
jgi:carbon monoxide dehydrogenase subunit G